MDSLDTLLHLHERSLQNETFPRAALYKGPLFQHLRPNVAERDAIAYTLYLNGHIETGESHVHP